MSISTYDYIRLIVVNQSQKVVLHRIEREHKIETRGQMDTFTKSAILGKDKGGNFS